MIRVSVIIPTFNRLDELARVFAALDKQTRRDFEVILVDNGSTDGTEEVMTARETEGGPMPFRYQRIAPAGPAGARNAGIAVARGEYLAFIDSDVELAPDWLALAAAELDDDAALQGVGGVVLYASDPGMVNAYGGVLSRIGLAWDADEGQPRAAIKRVEPRTWINCSAYLVRATAVRAVGGFDPRFFYGFEDSDLGWRISAVLGPQKVIPGAVCLHNVGEAIGRADARLIYHGAKNRLASLIANARATHLAWALPVYLAYALVDIALRGQRRAKLAALGWNLRHLGGTLARRKQLSRLRRTGSGAEVLFAPRLFPSVRLNGMRRRPNRLQTVSADASADDRVL